MNQLSANDYELLLKFVGELHQFRSRSSLRNWLLDDALPRLVPSDWLSYNEVNLQSPEKTIAILKPESNLFFDRLFRRFRELAYQHPLIVRQMESDNFPVHKISDFLTREAYHRLELYQDVYRLMGVEYQIAATIRLSPTQITAFALSRRLTDYTERDRSVLEVIRPHLVVAFNNLELKLTNQSLIDSAELALTELSSATLMVDSHGQVLYHTGPGKQWLGITNPGRLPQSIADWLGRAFAKGMSEPLSWTSDAGSFLIRALPSSIGGQSLLVISKDKNHPRDRNGTAASQLSQRQREVARWIREGKTNAEIAAIMGISPRTVQKHIEHIFEKLGVETRVSVATRFLD